MLEKIMLYIGFIQINVVFFVWLYRFRRYRLADYIKGLPAEKAKSEFCPAQLEWEVKLKGAASSEGLMIVRDGVGWKVKEDKRNTL